MDGAWTIERAHGPDRYSMSQTEHRTDEAWTIERAHGPDRYSVSQMEHRMDGAWTRWSMDQINGSWTRQVAQGPDRWSMVWMEHGKQKSIYVNGTWRARNVPEMMPRS